MRTVALLLLGALLGCSRATALSSSLLPAAQSFQASFAAALAKRGAVEAAEDGSAGSAGNTRTLESKFRIASKDFAPEDLGSIIDKAAWFDTALGGFGTRGAGGGGNHYHVHFGDHQSHAFVDLVAYRSGEFTEVLSLIRVQE